MKVLVCGRGQLGAELARTCPDSVELIHLGRDALDISDAGQVDRAVAELKPAAIINAAAYTAVDKAETDADAARAGNEVGPANLARAAANSGAYLLHISTDFVFDGAANTPYLPDAPVSPLGVYGQTKLAGEVAIAESGLSHWAILRTAWVFSALGNNFVKTILRLAADRPKLTIIADQIGSPTCAKHLAKTCWLAVNHQLQGIYHCTCDGVASWYDFAMAIQELGAARGLLSGTCDIAPIRTEDYPTPARRPHYSVLSNASLREQLPEAPGVYWRKALAEMLDELANR